MKTTLIVLQGLVTTERSKLDPAVVPFAKNPAEIREGASIVEVVKLKALLCS